MTGPATLTCDAFLDLAAVVVLDAADEDAARQVAEHAAACPDCARRLAELQATAAALGLAVPQVEPPPAVRERLFATVAREPRRRPRAGLRRLRLAPAWLAAAAAFLVSVVALVWVAVLQTQLAALRTDMQVARDRAGRYDRVVDVLASDALAIRPLQPAVQTMPSRGMVYLDPDSGTGMVTCHDMPPVPAGHAYQVWFVRGSERISAGMVWPDRDGNGYTLIQVPKDVQSFDSIGLTDEPGSGSAWPTTPRVIGTPLRSD
jgi:hypothetical protein